MELLVHVSTSGHLLLACMQAMALGIETFSVHVIMGTPTPHLLLWAMTIFVKVLQHPVIGMSIGNANPPWFTKNLTTPTTDRIEVRLCLNSEGAYVNVALELLELYIH